MDSGRLNNRSRRSRSSPVSGTQKSLYPTRVSAASFLLYGVAALAPVPFGSTDIAAIGFWCFLLGIAVCVAPIEEVPVRRLGLFFLPLGLTLGAYAFVLHEQLSANPLIARPHPLWIEGARILDAQIAPSVSIARNLPFFALGNSLLCLLALVCGFLVGADEKRARRLIRIVAWAGAVLAVYGIVAHVVDPTRILWRPKLQYETVLTATFVNRNTAAVYFGSCAVIWFVFLARSIRRRAHGRALNWRFLFGDLLRGLPPRMVLECAALLVCLAAMFMTASRAGAAVSLLGLVLAWAVLFRDTLSTRSGFYIGFGSAAFVVVALLQVMGAGVIGRLEIQGADEGGRLQTYLTTLQMISDHPWFGTGLGTYMWAHPAYRSPELPIWGIWDRAHSTPLELAADLGVPFATIVVLDWLIVLGVLVRGLRVRQRGLVVPLVALCVSMIALLHSMIDFSLQIPGFAVIVFALAGAGMAQSFRPAERPAKERTMLPARVANASANVNG